MTGGDGDLTRRVAADRPQGFDEAAEWTRRVGPEASRVILLDWYRRGMRTTIPSEWPAPLEIVEGDCGLSFLEIELDAVGWYRVRTGFHVDRRAVEYHWKVNVVGPRLNRSHTWSGPLRFRRDWRGSRRGDIRSEGDHEATVVPPESYAVAYDGGVCYSGGPRDREYIF